MATTGAALTPAGRKEFGTERVFTSLLYDARAQAIWACQHLILQRNGEYIRNLPGSGKAWPPKAAPPKKVFSHYRPGAPKANNAGGAGGGAQKKRKLK